MTSPLGRMRWLALGFVVAPCLAHGQTGVFRTVQVLLDQQRQQGVIPNAAQIPPTTPATGDTKTPRTGALPESQGNDDAKKLKILPGGMKGRRDREKVHFEGGTEFEYRGYRVVSDTADGDMSTGIFDLRGKVHVLGKDTDVRGERVILDYKKRTYQAFDADTEVSPSYLKGRFTDKAYVHAGESSGTENHHYAVDSRFTTCDLPDPHFDIDARNMDLIPGRRVIFRYASIRILDHKLITLPYLWIPLEDRTYKYLPEVGRSDEEGYYIKNRYGVPLRGEGNNVDFRLDYMSKLGVGYGADYDYQGRNMSGRTHFYKVSGNSNTLEITNQHKQKFGWGDLSLDNSFVRNDYLYTLGTTSLSTRGVVSIPQKGGNTRVTFQRQGTDSGYTNSQSEMASVSDTRTFGKYQTSVDLNWSDTKYTYSGGSTATNTETQQLDVRLHGQKDINWATASIDYQRSIPIGNTSSFYGGADRTPVFSLQSDSKKLMGAKWPDTFPIKTEFSLGEYYDATSKGRYGRGMFDLTFQRQGNSKSNLNVDTNGQFRQTVYSDDTAQYLLGMNTTVSYKVADKTTANLRYNYLRPYGYAPLLTDQTGETNQTSADLSYRLQKPWLVGVQTGFDVNRLKTSDVGWQQLGLRSEYQPDKNLLFRTLATYDTISQVWSNVRFDFTRQMRQTSLSLGVRYDGTTSTWGNVNLLLTSLQMGRVNFSTMLTYNGYTKKFDAQQYSFIYDLHCAEAVLTWTDSQTGYRPGRDIQFFVRLKAIPVDSLFGTSSRGQSVGTGTGRDF